jgi:hypothetical protein
VVLTVPHFSGQWRRALTAPMKVGFRYENGKREGLLNASRVRETIATTAYPCLVGEALIGVIDAARAF